MQIPGKRTVICEYDCNLYKYDVKVTCQRKDKKLHEGKSICSKQTVREEVYREANVEACVPDLFFLKS